MFIGLLCFSKYICSINTTDNTTVNTTVKCISLNNQKCMTQSTLISLNSNEYIER